MNTLQPADVGIGTLFGRIRDAVIVIESAEGHVLLWNAAATAIFGFSAEEAIGESIELIIPPELRETHRAGLGRYDASGYGPLLDEAVPLTLPALHKSGRRLTVELTLSPISSTTIDARLVLAIIRDLSERVRADQAQAAAEAADELNRRMDVFLGIASHELLTPLTTIRGNIQLAARRLKGNEQREAAGEAPIELGAVHTALSRADLAGERLEILVRELLDVTRIAADKLELRAAPVDLAALAREAVAERLSLAPDALLRLDLPETPVIVQADAFRLEQVLINFLSNAQRYAPGAEVTVGVRVEAAPTSDPASTKPSALSSSPVRAAASTEPKAPEMPQTPAAPVSANVEPLQARVWVRDEGPGVPLAVQARLWDRFFQVERGTSRPHGAPSLGLGLFICRAIIEAHGGAVGLDSAPGQGATFWFTLPLA